jgi:hypothetical protein
MEERPRATGGIAYGGVGLRYSKKDRKIVKGLWNEMAQKQFWIPQKYMDACVPVKSQGFNETNENENFGDQGLA